MRIRIAILSALVLSALVLFAAASPAHALLDLRATYSMLQTNPEDLNTFLPAMPKLAGMQAFGADAVAHLPAFPIGLGVRYERFTSEKDGAAGNAEARYIRTSVIVTKRLIDTGAYFGFIATGGISNDFTYETSAGGGRNKYKADGGFSGSAGIETGMNLMVLKIGAEAGYMHAPLGHLKNAQGAELTDVAGNKIKADLSGTYVRAVVGFGF